MQTINYGKVEVIPFVIKSSSELCIVDKEEYKIVVPRSGANHFVSNQPNLFPVESHIFFFDVIAL